MEGEPTPTLESEIIRAFNRHGWRVTSFTVSYGNTGTTEEPGEPTINLAAFGQGE